MCMIFRFFPKKTSLRGVRNGVRRCLVCVFFGKNQGFSNLWKNALGLVRALIFDVLSDRRTHNKRFSFRVHANILPGHARAAPEARAARAERAQRSIAESKTARHAREARALRASRTESAARAA